MADSDESSQGDESDNGDISDEEVFDAELEEDDADEADVDAVGDVDETEETPSDQLLVGAPGDKLMDKLADGYMTQKRVPDDMRCTNDFLTTAEFTEAINCRIAQLEAGSPAYCDTTGLHSATEVALRELHTINCPFILTRVVRVDERKGIIWVEYWKMSELNLHNVQGVYDK